MIYKLTLLAGLLSLTCTTTEAQSDLSELSSNPYGPIKTGSIGRLATSKTETSGERVVASSKYVYTAGIRELTDSASYKWSRGRRSALWADPVFTDNPTMLCNGYDQSQTWWRSTTTPFSRQLNTFDASGRIIESIQQDWEESASAWKNKMRNSTTYTAKDRIHINELWDESGKRWKNNTRDSYTTTPDADTYSYDISDGSTGWTPYTLSTLKRSSKVSEEALVRNWNAAVGNWENATRITNTYDALGHIIKSLEEKWEVRSGSWQNVMQDQATYSGEQLIQFTKQRWNKMSGWVNNCQGTFSWSGDKVSECLGQFWNDETSAWRNESNTHYNYTGSNLVRIKTDAWDRKEGIWTDYLAFDYTHTAEGNISNTRITKLNGSGPELSTEHYFYYEKFTTAIPTQEHPIATTRLYPNPSTADQVYLDYATPKATATEIILSDISGKVLQHITEPGSIGDHSVSIPVAELTKGIYFVQLFSEGQLLQTLKLSK